MNKSVLTVARQADSTSEHTGMGLAIKSVAARREGTL
jgi:hypothetical protein